MVSVRFLLIISQLAGLETQALDFVLIFPQEKIDVPFYMKILPGIDIENGSKDEYLISLKSSLYGIKQSSANWYDCLQKGLERHGFRESKADPCVFMKKGMIILTYVDDCILIANKKETLDQFIHSLANGIKKFEFTDGGAIDKYMGVEVEQFKGKEFILRKTFLIRRILVALNVKSGDYNQRDSPVIGPLLRREELGAKRKHDWSYRSAIGMLGYLQNSTRTDIYMSVLQCSRFNAH